MPTCTNCNEAIPTDNIEAVHDGRKQATCDCGNILAECAACGDYVSVMEAASGIGRAPIHKDCWNADAPLTDETETDPRTLEQQIREKLVVDLPDEDTVCDALDGAVTILPGSYDVAVEDAFYERDEKAQLFTYLLAKWAASIVDPDAYGHPYTSIHELDEAVGHETVDEYWDSYGLDTAPPKIRIDPESLDSTATWLEHDYWTE